VQPTTRLRAPRSSHTSGRVPNLLRARPRREKLTLSSSRGTYRPTSAYLKGGDAAHGPSLTTGASWRFYDVAGSDAVGVDAAGVDAVGAPKGLCVSRQCTIEMSFISELKCLNSLKEMA
jgi:hypothetical protein